MLNSKDTILLIFVSAKTLHKQGGDLQSNAKVSNTHNVFKQEIWIFAKTYNTDAAWAPSLDLSPSGCRNTTGSSLDLDSCWSARGSNFSRIRWEKTENTENAYNMLFSVLLPRPACCTRSPFSPTLWIFAKTYYITILINSVYELLFSWRPWRDTKPPSSSTSNRKTRTSTYLQVFIRHLSSSH